MQAYRHNLPDIKTIFVRQHEGKREYIGESFFYFLGACLLRSDYRLLEIIRETVMIAFTMQDSQARKEEESVKAFQSCIAEACYLGIGVRTRKK